LDHTTARCWAGAELVDDVSIQEMRTSSGVDGNGQASHPERFHNVPMSHTDCVEILSV
jgi:hypothetical protein